MPSTNLSMVRTIKQSAILLAFVVIVAAFAEANAKYKEYMQQSLGNLLLMCTEGDDNGSYFYAEMQAKHGNLKEALNAHIIGAQNANQSLFLENQRNNKAYIPRLRF